MIETSNRHFTVCFFVLFFCFFFFSNIFFQTCFDQINTTQYNNHQARTRPPGRLIECMLYKLAIRSGFVSFFSFEVNRLLTALYFLLFSSIVERGQTKTRPHWDATAKRNVKGEGGGEEQGKKKNTCFARLTGLTASRSLFSIALCVAR